MKNKIYYLALLFLFSFSSSFSQVAINTNGASPHPSAMLDIQSTTRGLLIPTMTVAQRNSITSPATGLLIFQSDSTAGFYYYTGTAWTPLTSGGTVTGSGTNGYITFWNGTNSVTGSPGLKWQGDTLLVINGRVDQTGLGYSTFFGYQAGILDNLAYSYNSAFGYQSFYSNTSGLYNSAFGYNSLYSNTDGDNNSAFGHASLAYNTTGNYNSAFGMYSLYHNTSGLYNSAFGYGSLENNTTGYDNSALGMYSLENNTTGYYNSAFGRSSLIANTTGYDNSAFGYQSLMSNTTGFDNTAVGYAAGIFTYLSNPNQTSIRSVYLGSNTKSYANGDTNEIVIGYSAIGVGSNSVVLGNSSITKTILQGRVGLGTGSPETTSIMDLNSTSKGLLIPRMNQTQRNAISSPATGLLIYQTDNTPGFYYYSGSAWTGIGTGTVTGSGTNGYVTFWNGTSSVTGETNLFWDATNNRLGINTSTPNAPLQVNGRIFQDGLGFSVFLGYNAGRDDDLSDNRNTGVGYSSLQNITTGEHNTAIGTDAGAYANSGGNNQTSSQSVYIGSDTRSSASGNTNEIVIGFQGRGLGSNSVVLGNSSITKTALRGSVGIGTESPNSSSILELTSTAKGILIPRMTQTQRNAISSSATGLLIYQTDNTPGFYYYSGSAWTSVSSGTVTGSGTNGYVTFWNGTNSVTGSSGLKWQGDSLLTINGRVDQTGLGFSTFFGYQAGIFDDGISNYNSAFGYQSLYKNISGYENSAFGNASLKNNTDGFYNSAFGNASLTSNTSGYWNSAFGNNALYSNTTGNYNSAFGFQSLFSNTTGASNFASGQSALYFNTTGNQNSASGRYALYANTTGSLNSAFGFQSLFYNTTGYENTAVGYDAGASISSGGNNQSSFRSVYLGTGTRAYLNGDSNEIVIGYNATGLGSNTVVIGNTSITKTALRGLVGVGTESPTQTLDVNGNGRFRSVGSGPYDYDLHLTSDGTLTKTTSDERLKTNIEKLNNTLEKISKLRGVSFNWKNEPDGKKHLGFIAQEVEGVIPELVFTNPVDGYKGINYSEITAALVEGIKEQQSQINKLQDENTELKNRITSIEKKINGKQNITDNSDLTANPVLLILISTFIIAGAIIGINKFKK